jgi:hypothetical protein
MTEGLSWRLLDGWMGEGKKGEKGALVESLNLSLLVVHGRMYGCMQIYRSAFPLLGSRERFGKEESGCEFLVLKIDSASRDENRKIQS